MQTPLTYTFDDGKWPVDRLAIKHIEADDTFSGSVTYPIEIDSVRATLHMCNPPDSYIDESRYVKVLPELLASHPTALYTSVSGDTISYQFDSRKIPVTEGNFYALEFAVTESPGSAHYIGKIIISINEG